MNKISKILAVILSALALLFFMAFTTATFHGDGSYNVDTDKSNLEWTGKKFTGEHVGNIKIKSGTLVMGGHALKSGEFEIDMTTINCTDLKGGAKEDIESHLRNKDFFHTKKFPIATFKITSSGNMQVDQNGNNYWVKGDFSMKGISNEIKISCNLKIAGTVLTIMSRFSIDRTKWDIKYKSKTIFPDLGDKFLYDEIDMRLKLVANKIH
ncbi:MAG: lipid-binding protein [Bacteroidetes bacterium]|nr:MAG: lipid-binding protein [Bacteroidota bacterium]